MNYGVSPETISAKAEQLAALIAVHMFGFPVDVKALRNTLGTLPIIEDCAHAYGSRQQGSPVGSEGVAAVFSFGPAKWPACGGGGALFGDMVHGAERLLADLPTKEAWHIRAVEALRRWRRTHKNCLPAEIRRRLHHDLQITAPPTSWHVPGEYHNSALPQRMSTGERLVLERKVRLFPKQLARQRQYARLAMEALAGAGVTLPSYVDGSEPNFYVLPLRFDSAEELLRVRAALAAQCVETHRYQRGISQIAARYYGYAGDCPHAEQAEETVLWVPLHHGLQTMDIERMIDVMRQTLSSNFG